MSAPTSLIRLTELSEPEIRSLEVEQLEEMLNQAPGLKRLIKVAEERAKELLLEDEDSFEGRWFLKPGAKVEKVADSQKAATLLLALQGENDERLVQPTELLALAKFGISDLRSLYKEKTGLDAKAAKDTLATLLEEAMETTRNAPSLAKAKDLS